MQAGSVPSWFWMEVLVWVGSSTSTESWQGAADVSAGAVLRQVCRASGAPVVGRSPASLVLPKHPAGWHFPAAASLLTLDAGKQL